ncbi:CopG family transcriptional regulator [Actinomyces oricola]|uniref:CopG family transcriptional regulator n=1 Tax=Actinomyces oricola TaxID=206043 RepID=UPI000FFE4EC7|nr:CopG family transcriptional regulator [Actinomyces oricola]
MRTTVRLDPEVAAAAEQLRRERQVGLGEAVNELARAGLARKPAPTRFRQRTAHVGLKVDVTDVADVLDLLDQDGTRATHDR